MSGASVPRTVNKVNICTGPDLVSMRTVGGFSLVGIIQKAFDVYLTSLPLSVARKELSAEYSLTFHP